MEQITSRGTSMVPSIFPGARLKVGPLVSSSIKVGDLVWFLDKRKVMVVHRVIGVGTREPVLHVRGDAQRFAESIPLTAILGKVMRVEQGWLSYDVGGPVGQLLCKMAIDERRRSQFLRLGIAGAASLGYRIASKIMRVLKNGN